MPKIPEFQTRTGLIPDRPPGVDINPNAFGYTNDAIAKAGGALVGLGTDIVEKRKNAEDNDFLLTKSLERKREVEDYSVELQKTIPLGHVGYTDKMKEFINQRYEEDQKAAPSQSAKAAYQDKVGSMYTHALIEARALEGKKSTEAKLNNVDDQIKMTTNVLITNPNPDSAIAYMKDLEDGIRGGIGTLYSAEDADKKVKDAQSKVSNSIMQGFLVHETDPVQDKKMAELALKYLRRDPDAAGGALQQESQLKEYKIDTAVEIGLLPKEEGDKLKKQGKKLFVPSKENISMSGGSISPDVLTKGLTATERAGWIDKFQDKLKAKSREDIGDFSRQVSNLHAALFAGENVDDMSVRAKIKDYVKQGVMTASHGVTMEDDLNYAKAAGQVAQRMMTAPIGQLDALKDTFDNHAKRVVADSVAADPSLAEASKPYFNFASRERAKDYLAKVATDSVKERYKDGAAYAIEHYPGMAALYKRAQGGDPAVNAELVNRLKDIQKDLPEHLVRIQPKYAAEATVRLFQGADEQLGSQLITGLQAKYGDNYAKVMDELVQAKLPEEIKLAALTPSQFDRQRLFGNAKNKKQISIEFDQTKKINKGAKDLDGDVAEVLSDFRVGLTQGSVGGGNAHTVNSIHNNVLTEAQRMMNENPGMDSKDAAKKAYTLITNTFDVSSGVANSNVIVPKVIGNQKISLPSVQAYMSSHLTEEGLSDLKIGLQSGRSAFKNLPPEERKKMTYAQILETGKWVTNRDQTGIFLQYEDPERGLIYAEDENHNVIQKSYTDLTKNPNKRTLEEMKGSWGRLKDRLF